MKLAPPPKGGNSGEAVLSLLLGPSPTGTSFFKLPSGELQPGESETEGIQRIVNDTLGNEDSPVNQWPATDVVANWWRPNFESPQYPYIPPHCSHPKVSFDTDVIVSVFAASVTEQCLLGKDEFCTRETLV